MGDARKSEIFIDEQIPVERQINFLRNWTIDRDLVMYNILKEELGEEGEKLNRLIKVRLMDKAMTQLAKEKEEFEPAKNIAGYVDRILGYKIKVDDATPEKLQISLSNCPYLEKAKEYGMEKAICELVCEFEVQQAKERGIGELMILSKIAEGADKCTFKLEMAKK